MESVHLSNIGEKFVFTDRETAIMSIATAVGGSQLLLLNRLGGKSSDSSDVIASPSSATTQVVFALGSVALVLGIAGIFEKIDIPRPTTAGLVGYGMSTLFSIGLPIIMSAVSKSEAIRVHPGGIST
jgi:hypothetical protein